MVLDASDKGFDWGNFGANKDRVMEGEIEGAFVGVWFEVLINSDRKVKDSGAAAPAVLFIPLFTLFLVEKHTADHTRDPIQKSACNSFLIQMCTTSYNERRDLFRHLID